MGRHPFTSAFFPSISLYGGCCRVCFSAAVSLDLKRQIAGWSSAGGCQRGCHVFCYVFCLCDFNVPSWSFLALCNKASLLYMFSFFFYLPMEEKVGYKETE